MTDDGGETVRESDSKNLALLMIRESPPKIARIE